MEDNTQNDDSGMSIFDQENLELVGQEEVINPDEESQEDSEQENDDSENNSDDDNTQNNNPGENQDDSEEVAKGEDEEEEDSSDEDDDSSNTRDENDSSELYSSFASVLSEKGLLPSLDLEENEIKDIDSLSESIRSEIDNQTKKYITDKIGENGYEALEKGVSLKEFESYQDTMSTLDQIDEDSLENNMELSKNIIKQDYINQGMSEDRANKILSKSIDLGEESVLDDARDSLESLKASQNKKMEQLQQEREQAKQDQVKQQEKIDNDLKNSIYNSKEIIEGIKPSKTIKDKVYNSITNIVGESPDGVPENKLIKQRRENPIEFDTKLYYLYELTDGFKNFSDLINKSESKAVSKLEKNMRKNKFEGSENPTYMDDPESYGGIGSDSELVL